MRKKYTLLWFLLGLGSKLQIVASLSITELIVLLAAPFIFMKNHRVMKRDGIMTFWWMSILVIVGCMISSIANDSHPAAILRGMATTCLISSSIIFSHWIIRNDASGFKWLLLGIAFSGIISIFYFQNVAEVAQTGGDVDLIVSGPLFWIQKLKAFVMLPTNGWYVHMPTVINVAAPLLMAVFAILTSQSGRSTALSLIAFVVIVLIGGKKAKTMMRMSKYFGLICFIGIVLIIATHRAYKVAATQGWLGEGSRQKYEIQAKGDGGIGRLLLGGRADSFVGLLACRDKPIIGFGPWAMDVKGYFEEFMVKYGTYDDVMALQRSQQYNARMGTLREHLIGCHSYITEFWLWYGIFGLLFWIYVIFVLLRYLKQDCFVVPQWFAWLACSIPGMFWNIFFSPFDNRFGVPLFVVACLMARAVRHGSFQLPFEMMEEIEKSRRG